MEDNGTEIGDDEILSYFINQNKIFILLNNNEKWIENKTLSAGPSTSTSSASTSSSSSPSMSNWELNFQIPWDKFPTHIMNLLNEKKILKKELNAFGNIIVDKMRMFSTFIPMKTFRNVARDVSAKYPDSFLEKDSDGLFGSEPIALIEVLKNRNNTLNRSQKRKDETIVAPKDLKIVKLYKSTCQNWDPEIPNIEIEKMFNTKKELLRELYREIPKINEDEVKDMMKETFALQRKFLNAKNATPPLISEILTEWPFLFCDQFRKDHFEELTNLSNDKFLINYETYKKKIFGVLKQTGDFNDHQLFKAITNYFKEDLTFLYMEFKVLL